MVIRMELVLILDNLRSTYNVGAILRTAEAVGVSRVIAVGTTPYPELDDDTRPRTSAPVTLVRLPKRPWVRSGTYP
jgi:hypothetical protein